MEECQWRHEIAAKTPQLQIIVGALVAGCVFFLAIVVFLGLVGEPAEAAPQSNILTYISLLFGAIGLIAARIVPTIMLKRAYRCILNGSWQPPQGAQSSVQLNELIELCGDAGRLWFVYQTGTIVRAALIEGAAFFLLVVYMIERSPLTLIGAVILIFVLAAQFPSRSRMVHWVEDQLNSLEQQRQFGSIK